MDGGAQVEGRENTSELPGKTDPYVHWGGIYVSLMVSFSARRVPLSARSGLGPRWSREPNLLDLNKAAGAGGGKGCKSAHIQHARTTHERKKMDACDAPSQAS